MGIDGPRMHAQIPRHMIRCKTENDGYGNNGNDTPDGFDVRDEAHDDNEVTHTLHKTNVIQNCCSCNQVGKTCPN